MVKTSKTVPSYCFMGKVMGQKKQKTKNVVMAREVDSTVRRAQWHIAT